MRCGEATTAALTQNDGFVQLQLVLQDGGEKIIRLFEQIAPKAALAK